MKLMMLKGLPGSGKTTYSATLVKEGWVRVNKDDLRKMMHNSKHSRMNESQVLAMRDFAVELALKDGRDVVVDDTNLAPKHTATLCGIALRLKAEFLVMPFEADLDTCIERDLNRPNSVGKNVIYKMYREYIKPRAERADNDKELAVIVDIDGTIATMKDRGPYEWDKVGNDTLNEDVVTVVDMFAKSGYRVLIFSGRDGVCADQTEKWLTDNMVDFDELLMRAPGDNRKDYEVKREFYDALKDKYNITHVIDDRMQVCRLWYELGLCLLKVGDPELEF